MTMAATLLTAGRMIRMAYKDAGLLQDGDDLTGEQLADGMMRLNDLVNLWQTQGLKLWLIEDIAIPLTASQGTYSFGPSGDIVMLKPLRIIQGYFLTTATGIRRPLILISKEEYTRLSMPSQTGPVTSFYVDKQKDLLYVYLWQVPDATAASTGQVYVVAQTQTQNYGTLTDRAQFPVEWAMAIRWGLADELSTGQPQSIMSRCSAKAASFRAALDDWDVEDASTSFAPDQRMLYAARSFR